MSEVTTKKIPHTGKKIERIRTLKGIKQTELAKSLGMAQGTLSKIEKNETVEEDMLEQIAKALGVTVESIKAFTEDGPINIIANTVNNHDQSASVFNNPTFNPIDKIVELYERLLQAEREKVALYEQLHKKENP
jgi:transcriptional regulator with XRE-family HTH domain